jgi:replication factor C subunit 1
MPTVALCGVNTDYDRIVSFLSSSGHTVVPWASNIGRLVCGDGAAGRWKIAEAKRLGIAVVTSASVLADAQRAGELWVTRYTPRRLRDMIGGAAPINELSAWLTGWGTGAGAVRGALVTGPPGIGKTTAVGLIVRGCGYELVEFNASDERSASAVRKYFDEAKRSGCCGKRRVIVMDEVDGMSNGDRGGIGTLAALIRG